MSNKQDSRTQRWFGAVIAGIAGFSVGSYCGSPWAAFLCFFILGILGYNWLTVVQAVRSGARVAAHAVASVIRDVPAMFRKLLSGFSVSKIARGMIKSAQAMPWFAAHAAVCFTVAFICWAFLNDTEKVPATMPFVQARFYQAAGNLLWMAKSDHNFRVGVFWGVNVMMIPGLLAATLWQPVQVFFVMVMSQSKKQALANSAWIIRSLLWPVFYGVFLLIPHFVGTLLLVVMNALYTFKRFMHGVAVALGGSLYLVFVPFKVEGIPTAALAIGCALSCLAASEGFFRVLENAWVKERVKESWALMSFFRPKQVLAGA